MNKQVLLDASALLALINQENGADIVEGVLPISIISAVNFSEVLAELRTNSRLSLEELDTHLVQSIPDIVEFDYHIAPKAAELKRFTKEFGLSLGDRACIATGLLKKIPIYTADKIWAKLQLDCEIIVVAMY